MESNKVFFRGSPGCLGDEELLIVIKLGGFKYFLFSPLLGEWFNVTNTFQMG